MPRPDKTPLIFSLLSSSPDNPPSDQAIAEQVGVTAQRVAQVRKKHQGARPMGRPPITGAAPRNVRLPDEIDDLARAAGQSVSEYVRTAVAMRRVIDAGKVPGVRALDVRIAATEVSK